MNSLEIKDTKAQLKKRAYDMINSCKVEIRMFTPDEEKEYNDIKSQIKNLNAELKVLERSLNNSDEEINNIKSTIKSNFKSMEKRFSIVNAIKSVANNQMQDDVTVSVSNAGKEEMRKAGLSMGGQIQLPTEELRAITVTAEGEDVVPTDLYDIMAPLRAKNVLVQAGAKFLTGLVGDVQIPIMSASNVGWAGEVAAASDGAGSFTHKTLSPKRLTAYIDISKQLLNQDAIGVENMIRQDIVNAINNKLEATILGAGDGKAGGDTVVAPKGMFNGKTTVKSVTDMSKIAEVESTVESANVLGECKYVIAPTVKATLRSKAKGENVSESLYSNNEIDGTPALSTGHVAANKFIYGDWSNLAIGQWGPLDLTVDTYTQAVNGCVRLVINAYFDAVVLRDNAFVYGQTTAAD